MSEREGLLTAIKKGDLLTVELNINKDNVETRLRDDEPALFMVVWQTC